VSIPRAGGLDTFVGMTRSLDVRAVVVGLGIGTACGGGGGTNGAKDAGADVSHFLDGPSGHTRDATSSKDGGTPTDASPSETGPAPIAGLRAFFTDLTSGPSSGGQGGKGAFVTVYGNGFGASQGTSTVTIGGGDADNYPVWSNTKITFQLGAAAKSGDVVVNVAGKGASNGLAFTVRAGNIYFVSSKGSDGADGSFATPWATIPKAKNTIMAGDVAYLGASAGDSVSQTTLDSSSSYDCALGMSVDDGTNQGTADAPKALVVYPGATATVGAETGLERGILTPAISGTFDYWVIAGLTLRGTVEAIDLEGQANGWRIIGNDISCPNGTGESGCVTGGPTNLAFYGNVVHDAAANVTTVTKYYHGIYFGSDHLDLGWNTVENGKTCRGIQFHNTGGDNEYDLHVHDNVIHDTVCDGLNFATVDPSQGTVEAYNNVIYNVGTGPDPADGASDYAGVYVAGETDDGGPGGGVVQIYDNTFYNCGSMSSSTDSGAFSNGGGNTALSMHLVNNLVYATGSEVYVSKDTPSALVTGQNNLWFGAGAAPAGQTASVTANPMLVSSTTFDFHLLAGSPAIGAGIVTTALFDFDGNPRGTSFDIGAYEHTM
jgi:hypothetical protein